tara:strand:+ start:13943 stop:16114 length:2172 start_codon:yes stop_codon:yes gene_type:complete
MRFLFTVIFCCLIHSASAESVSFRNDVLPILSGAGCNAGGCHAKQGGQNGFHLTIFAFDPIADYREIVHNAKGRRVFPASPDESLLLLKATQQVPHEGGERFAVGSRHHRILRDWIEQGMPLEIPGEPSLDRISVAPEQGRFQKGETQQYEVTAHYSDGSTRVVTDLSEFQSPDQGIVAVDENGLAQIGSVSGEGVIIVRYLDRVEIARVAVPPGTTLPTSTYASLPKRNRIDELTYARHQELGLRISEPAEDFEFLRRASLDATGRLPSVDRARSFLSDQSADRRERLIDELLRDPNWADYWATKLGDLLRPNTQRVGVKPVYLLDRWIRAKLRANTPWDQLVRELLLATGSSHEFGPVAVLRNKREPDALASYVSQVFLGVRLDCAKCHHHPSEKWSQDDYYQMAAFFSDMKRKGQGISAPISGEPEFWWFEAGGEVRHPVTDAVMIPKPPEGPVFSDIPADQDKRKVLVDWMTSPNNPFFAKAIVNRVWGEFFGRGIVHPVDDFRASNPAVNEPLLDWLAEDFIENGFDLQHLMRRILNSHVYQISSIPNETNLIDLRHFSRSYRRRLPAEVLLDAVSDFTGEANTFQGVASQSRSVTTWNNKLPSTFLDTFGRPDSSADCPCERDPNPTMTQTLHLMNSTQLETKITQAGGRISELAASDKEPTEIIEELYLAAFSRLPTIDEIKIAANRFNQPESSRLDAVHDIAWALMNSAEFVLNH